MNTATSSHRRTVLSGPFLRIGKSLRLLPLLVLGLIARPLRADNFTYSYYGWPGSGIEYVGITGYTGAGGVVAIPSTIPSPYSGYPDVPVRRIEDSAFASNGTITNLTIPDSVTHIGASAFKDCTGLTGVNIGNGVTYIGGEAFRGCTSLVSAAIPGSATFFVGSRLFQGCTNLANVTLGNGIGYIGDYWFQGCASLVSVTIPNSVTSIAYYAFEGCTSLASLTIPSNVTVIPHYAFAGCSSLTNVFIPVGVTTIRYNAFEGCTSLASVNIPHSVTSIENSAFAGCSSLTSIVIPQGVTSIQLNTFHRCTSLTSVTIPNSVTSIGFIAFAFCTSLTHVDLPDSLTTIESSAFGRCTGLTSLVIPDSVTSIGSSAFQGCTGLTSVTISDGITSIATQTFAECTGLRSVIIPDNVTSIGNNAFMSCTQLTSVTIPNSVTSIGNGVFMSCVGLTSMTIPSNVTSVGNSGFWGCASLSSVIFLGNAPGVFGTNVFYGAASNFSIYYFECKSGFTSPLWMGYPAVELDCGGGSTVTFPLSMDLIALTIGQGSLSPAFNRGIEFYSAHLPFGFSSIPVTAEAASPYVTLKAQVQGGTPVVIESGVASEPLALAPGENLVDVIVSFGVPGLLITRTYTITVTRNTATDPLLDWRFEHFGTTENVGDAANGAIPHSDGVPNLLKFAFALNPSGPDARRMAPGGTVGLPASYLHENGGTVWRVEYLRRKNSGLTYTPKKSTTLGNASFTPLTGTQVVSEISGFPDWQRVIVDEPFNPSTTPRLFTTVEVTGG